MAHPEHQADVEAAITRALARIGDHEWSELWDAVDALAGDTAFATWAGGEVVETTIVDGEERHVRQWPYPVYSEAVGRVRRLLGLHVAVPFDWMRWDGMHRYAEEQSLAGAPVGDAVRVLIAIQRAERFCDGNIEGALKSGLMQAALNRLHRWYDDEVHDP